MACGLLLTKFNFDYGAMPQITKCTLIVAKCNLSIFLTNPGDEITLISCRSSLIFCKLSFSSVWQCSDVELSDAKNASEDLKI